RTRDALWADERRANHCYLSRCREIVQGSAAHSLPHPVEVPRRNQAAFRGYARTRVPDEGLLFLRSHGRSCEQVLRNKVRLRLTHLPPHGTQVDSHPVRNTTDLRLFP